MTPARMPANGPDGGFASAPGSADNIDVVPSTSVSPRAPLRAWRDTDIEAVLGINAASQPHVARLDRAEVRRLLVIGARIWVVTGDGDEVIAYLIAFPSDAPYDGQEFAYFTGRLGGGFLYVEQVAIHEAELKRLGKDYEFHIYPDAGHGFFYHQRPAMYRPEQAVDGWSKVFAFFERHLA